jgi:methylated-DNA-[protein]-cysteine S-methyltransferase
MLYAISYDAPVGLLWVVSDATHVRGVWMQGQKYFADRLSESPQAREVPVLAQTRTWLDAYFAGQRPAMDALPIAPEGSVFRQQVWQLLCDIPYGETTTYGALAQALAARTGQARVSAQAVGGAVGHNPLSIIVPCHRVVGRDGSLTGYAGGVDKKIQLLMHEGVDLSGLYVPKRGTAL